MGDVDLMTMVLTVLPMLLLIGAWFIFVRSTRSPESYQSRCLDAMQRQATALERIAVALEKRP